MSIEGLDPEKYELDEDGYARELVGPWVAEKHLRLAKYVDISRAVRRRFTGPGNAGATYIDLFCGPGWCRVRDTTRVLDGSPLVAWNMATEKNLPFSDVYISDADPQLTKACEVRLAAAGARVTFDVGPADEVVDRLVEKLNPSALHLAFLDPYDLKNLPFTIIQKLARRNNMDLLIHVSLQDLQRNFHLYQKQENSPLDKFAPGWRQNVDVDRSDQRLLRSKFLEYWRGLIKGLDMSTTEMAELVTGTRNQRLYHLVFAARHPTAMEFWEKVRKIEPDPQGSLL